MSSSTVDGPVRADDTAELPRALAFERPRGLVVAEHRPAPGPVRRPRRTWRRRLLDALVPVTLTTAVTTVLAWNMTGYPTATDDEGTYLAQAWAVQHGLGLAPYTYWYDHPPLAWLQLAGLSWVPAELRPQALAVGAGRLAMVPVVVACLLLVYGLARRLGMARWAAGLALLAYGLSPISVTMLRQIYLDSFAVMWILLALVLALSPRKHLWHHMAAGVATAAAVLSKETMLIVVPAVVLALWQSTARTTVRPWAVAGFASGLFVGAFYPLYAVLKGEFFPGPGHVSLLGAWNFQLGRPGSGSLLNPASGSAELLGSWLYYDWVLLVGGVIATGLALTTRRLRAPALAAALLVVVSLRPGGYLPAMYVIQVLPFFALALAGVVEVGVRRLAARHWRLPRLGAPVVRAAAALVAVVSLAVVVPGWYDGDRRAVLTNANAGYAAAASYLRGELPGRTDVTVVVDDVLWVDLVRAGYPMDRVLWFYKVDLDPAVAARLPQGWRDVDYVISTPAIRQVPVFLPTVRSLLNHSTVVKAFGDGDGRIEVRRIDKEKP